MHKLKNKILSVLLTAAMVLSMSSVIASSDEVDVTDNVAATEEAETEETTDSDSSSDEKEEEEGEEEADLTDEQGLAQMKKYAENSDYKLYVNEETTVFAVQSKADNYVWWSAPLNAENDEIAKAAQKKTMIAPFYVTYGNVAEKTTDKINAFVGSVKNKDFEIKEIENGVRFDFYFKKLKATIPMTVTLDDDFVNVQILSEEIVEEETTDSSGYCILTIGLLQFFAAGGIEDEGYMVVPDGSGAVINFNNQKINAQAYSNTVYGTDTSVTLLERAAKTEQVYLPVLGNIVKGEETSHGFLAIAAQGDTFATVNATVSGQSSCEYNNAWFEFRLRTEDTYYMGERKLTVFEAGKIKQPNVSVNFYPMSGKDISYVDMAERYRQYLTEEKGLTDKSDNIKTSYYLDLYGGTIKAQSIMGFPINLDTAATTYSQAKEILTKLTELGVQDIVVNYNDFNGAGIKGLISAGVDYAGTLGGKSEYTALDEYAESIGATIYPSVGITYMKDSGNGYSYTLNACRQTTKAYATTNNWDIAFGIPNQVRLVTKTTLSPYYWPDLFRKLDESFAAEGMGTICLGDATSLLYSDFSRDTYTRYDAMNIIVDGMKRLKDGGMTILADSANAYALPYVDYLTNVPLTSSNYDLFDYDVPFYSLVIHGVVPYTTKAVNASADASDVVMLALSTATPVHYAFMYNDPNEFTDSDYETLFYSNYKGWLESSAQTYKLVKEQLGEVADQKITAYNRVSEDVIETSYENGTTVVINTRERTMTVNGKSVDLTQYGLKGETNE